VTVNVEPLGFEDEPVIRLADVANEVDRVDIVVVEGRKQEQARDTSPVE
jgi:hypothetical protein